MQQDRLMRFPLFPVRIALAATHGAAGVQRRTLHDDNRNNNATLPRTGD